MWWRSKQSIVYPTKEHSSEVVLPSHRVSEMKAWEHRLSVLLGTLSPHIASHWMVGPMLRMNLRCEDGEDSELHFDVILDMLRSCAMEGVGGLLEFLEKGTHIRRDLRESKRKILCWSHSSSSNRGGDASVSSWTFPCANVQLMIPHQVGGLLFGFSISNFAANNKRPEDFVILCDTSFCLIIDSTVHGAVHAV